MTLKEKLQKEQEELKTSLLSCIRKQVSCKAHLFLFLAFFIYPVRAETSAVPSHWPAPVAAAHQLILQFQLEKADSAIQQLKQSPEKTYLLALRDFLKLMYTDEGLLYEKYLENSGAREEVFKKLQPGHPWKLFYLADLSLQESLLRIRNGDYLSGLYDLWQANRLLETTPAADSLKFLPYLKTKGVINLLVGLAPENYKWALDIIGLRGTIDQGLKCLKALERSDHPMSAEARLILGYFYLYPLNDAVEAIKYFSEALGDSGDNLLSRYLLASSYSKHQNGEKALTLMKAQPEVVWEGFPLGFYLLGDLWLQKGMFEQARYCYHAFRNHYNGSTFQKDVSAKIAVSYLLEGNTLLAAEWHEKSLAHGTALTAPDKNAETLLEEMDEYPHVLLKARLATDGGYLTEAWRLLRSYQPTENRRWTCEYYYRTARLYHLQENWSEALSFYKSVVELSEGENWYIGANAALLAGKLLVEAGDRRQAAAYFEKALGYDDHPYKASIDQQAKRSLALIRGE